MWLLLAVALPLAGPLLLAAARPLGEAALRALATAVAAAPLVCLAVVWAGFDPAGPRFQHVADLPWIPALGAGLRFGVDGLGLALAVTSALLFALVAAYPTELHGRARAYLGTVLFLEAVSIGVFVTLDLLLFYVFFDLSLVGMYFLVALWGHEDRERAALTFLLYTLAGSLVMLLGLLSLVLATDPLTFDMRVLLEAEALPGTGPRALLTVIAILVGLAVKTPVVPVHTWLPAAHVEAPGPASALLAGVLLKMGTFGMIRIAWGMLPAAFRALALPLAVVALVGIVYGAFVALGQRHLKRRIAYTSVTHMGYTVLGIAVAASLARGHEEARALALTGASLEMVAHALITGALFLVTGSIWRRARTFDMDALGGVASVAPRLAVFAAVASFASLGLPGLAGFVAEFQIFAGALAVEPWLAGAALVGVVVTAALFLELLQSVFLGPARPAVEGMRDLDPVETAALAVLLAATVALGVAPASVVDVLDATSRALVGSS